MNFLGHLYFSDNNSPLMVANLYGDFVKGKDYSHLPRILQDGVKLHREIDHYIDRHPEVLNLLHKLYDELPKVAGIAVDLYMDHLLASNWSHYHTKHYNEFIANFFDFIFNGDLRKFEKKNNFKYPAEFINLLTIMHRQEWIQNYKYEKGLAHASLGLSKRISFPNNLAEAPVVFKKHKTAINKTFQLFMNDAETHFKQFHNDMKNSI